MSGSGGGGGPAPNGDPCEKLTSETTLASPVRTVIAQLNVGTLLDVEVADTGGVRVVHAVYNGNIAGSITSTIIHRIAECIETGHQYVAEVLSVQGGACRVRIYHR